MNPLGRFPTVALVVLAPLAAAAVTAPPTFAQEVRDDAAAATEAAGVHTVRRGDTLWDLAARFLSDPLRWPAIYEMNPMVVEDPHWIYPGERLRIPGGAAVERVDRVRVESADDYLANVEEDGDAGEYPPGSIFRQPRQAGMDLSDLSLESEYPRPVVTADDQRRAPTVESPGARPGGRTVRVLEENPLDVDLPASARLYSDVVLALEGLAAAPGDTLKAVRRTRGIGQHGVLVTPKGLVEVTHVWSDSARGTVVRLYGDYEVGDDVVALVPYGLDPRARPDSVTDEAFGRIIGFAVEQVLLGPGDHVFLDAGEGTARLGDEYAVYPRAADGSLSPGAGDALAILRIVRVTDEAATATVVRMRDPGVRVGDPVLRTGRLPEFVSRDAPVDSGE